MLATYHILKIIELQFKMWCVNYIEAAGESERAKIRGQEIRGA